ncbi:MAG: hypothetical protein EBT63_06910, partial [Proteobacteria bacterium]|nr:hypothetical protein [Pseudomonadota bacterium]
HQQVFEWQPPPRVFARPPSPVHPMHQPLEKTQRTPGLEIRSFAHGAANRATVSLLRSKGWRHRFIHLD